MDMKNFPNKNDKLQEIQAKVSEDGQSIWVHTSDGWGICTINMVTKQGMASDIAAAIQQARDYGFEQGRAYVREAFRD